MILKASNGCFLTQSAEVPIEERKFEKMVTVSSMMEVADWKEITDTEKKKVESREAFFSVEKVDMPYLHKMDDVMAKIAAKINDAHLTNDESLEMQKYFPQWESLIGQPVFAEFRFVCDDILFEVVEPHVVSEDMKPTMQVMTLALMPDEEPQPTFYKKVLSSAEEAEEKAREEAYNSQKNINNETKI